MRSSCVEQSVENFAEKFQFPRVGIFISNKSELRMNINCNTQTWFMNVLMNNVIWSTLETFIVSFIEKSQFCILMNMETFVVTLDWINVS